MGQTWIRHQQFAWLLVVTAGVAFLLVGGLISGPDTDSAVFAVLGEGIGRGQIPYLDLWDHKPPGVYLIAAGAALMPGITWPWMWAFSVIATVAAAYLLMWITNARAALLAAFCMAAFPAAQGGGLTEPFAALPAVAALVLATRERFVWAGLAIGCSLLISLQFAGALAALAVLAPRSMLKVGAGIGVALLPLSMWLVMSGAGAEAVDALWRYQLAYASLDRSGDLENLAGLLIVPLPLVAIALMRRNGISRLELAATAWLIAGVALIAIQGRLFAHYAIPLVIPLAILAARPINDIARTRNWVLVAVITAYVLWAQLAAVATLRDRNVGEREVASWIQANAQPKEGLLVWGHEPDIYLEAEGRPVGRYVYLLPLTTPGYVSESMVSAWVRELRADPPELIVDSEAANPFWGPDDFFRPPPPKAAGGRDADSVAEFRDWVRAHYTLVAEVHGRKIYRPSEAVRLLSRDGIVRNRGAGRLPANVYVLGAD
jgi:hypothetical protein